MKTPTNIPLRMNVLWKILAMVVAGAGVWMLTKSLTHTLFIVVCMTAMVVCIRFWRVERHPVRYLALTLGILFGFAGWFYFPVLNNPSIEVVSLFTANQFGMFYVQQYANAIFNTLLLFASALLLSQYISRKKRYLSTAKQFLVSAVFALGVAATIYSPILNNPRYVYTLPEIGAFREIDNAMLALQSEGASPWNTTLIEARIPQAKLPEVRKILPYLKDANYISLLNMPLLERDVYLKLFALVCVALGFILNLRKNGDRSTFGEKLLFLVLAFLLVGIVQNYILREIIDRALSLRVESMGKLLSGALILVMTYVFHRRTKFLEEEIRQYREENLVTNPG